MAGSVFPEEVWPGCLHCFIKQNQIDKASFAFSADDMLWPFSRWIHLINHGECNDEVEIDIHWGLHRRLCGGL